MASLSLNGTVIPPPCPSHIQKALQHALISKENLLDKEINPVAYFMNFTRFEENANKLFEAFSILKTTKTTHTFAIKSNPLGGVLKKACKLKLGAECASIVEVKHAIQCGFEKEKIVFDSPAKTNSEIEFCIKNRIYMNCDNLNEIERVAAVLTKLKSDVLAPRVGLRINPGLGSGKISTSSTATKTSKFGVYIGNNKDEIIEKCKKYKFISGFHVHVGSQGCPLDMLVDGVKCITNLAVEINNIIRHDSTSNRQQQITILDFGGGLGINYDSDEDAKIHYLEYAKKLKESIVEFNDNNNSDNRFEIFTEFGRSMIQKCGWIGTYVNNVKNNSGRNIATCHVGSDMFLRTAYLPKQWAHRISVFSSAIVLDDNNNNNRRRRTTIINERIIKEKNEFELYDIAGPLCFSGDMIATKRLMPKILEGDWLVVHDAGGYTYSMHSRYNSIPAPAVYSYRYQQSNNNEDMDDKEKVELLEFNIVKERETWEDVCKFCNS